MRRQATPIPFGRTITVAAAAIVATGCQDPAAPAPEPRPNRPSLAMTSGQYVHVNDIAAIQKSQTTTGATEVRALYAYPLPSYQTSGLPSTTALPATDSTWAFLTTYGYHCFPEGPRAWYDCSHVDVIGIKKAGTASGRTELHELTASSGFSQFGTQRATALPETGSNFEFVMLRWDSDAYPDLVAIKKSHRNPFSGRGLGRTELHVLSGAGGYQTFLAQAATGFPEVGSDVTFDMADWDRDGRADLFAIYSKTLSGYVEVRIASAASSYTTFIGGRIITPIAIGSAKRTFFVRDYDRDGRPDLISVKQSHTASGKTEVHALSGASGAPFQASILNVATPLAPTGSNWTFAMPNS